MSIHSEDTIINPMYLLRYRTILDDEVYPVAQLLSQAYDNAGGNLSDIYDFGAPECSLQGAEEASDCQVILECSAFAKLFLYHFDACYRLPELDETEYAQVMPWLERYLSGGSGELYLQKDHLCFILWLYEHKRVSPRLAADLVRETVRRSNSYDPFLGGDDGEFIDRCENGFTHYVEFYRQVAGVADTSCRAGYDPD